MSKCIDKSPNICEIKLKDKSVKTNSSPMSEVEIKPKKNVSQIIKEHNNHYDYYKFRDWNELCEIMSS